MPSHTSKSVFAERLRPPPPSRRQPPPAPSPWWSPPPLLPPSLYLFSTSFCFFYQFPQGNPQPTAAPAAWPLSLLPPQTEKTAALEGIGWFSPCGGSPCGREINNSATRASRADYISLKRRRIEFWFHLRTSHVNDVNDPRVQQRQLKPSLLQLN